MNYLLIGGAGFIGSHLAEFLLNRGHSIKIIDNFSTGKKENIDHLLFNSKFELIGPYRKLATSGALEDEITKADCTFLLAASIGVDYFERNPRDSMLNNLSLEQTTFSIAEKYNKKVIYFSSSEVYGDLKEPAVESQKMQIGNPTISRWGYACSKLMGEFLINSYSFPSVVVRPFNIVGPRQVSDYGMVIPNFIEKAKRGENIVVYGDGKQIRCFCSIHDAVIAFYRLALNSNIEKDTFNVGNSNNQIDMHGLALMVRRFVNSNSKIVFKNERSDSDILCRIPNTSKIYNEIGWKANISLESIIEELI